jgi:hypothetical protein
VIDIVLDGGQEIGMATKSKSKASGAKKSAAKRKDLKRKKNPKGGVTRAKGSSSVVSLGKLGRIGDA